MERQILRPQMTDGCLENVRTEDDSFFRFISNQHLGNIGTGECYCYGSGVFGPSRSVIICTDPDLAPDKKNLDFWYLLFWDFCIKQGFGFGFVFKYWMFSFEAEGFSCSLGVLYGGLRISNLQFLIKKIEIKFPAIYFFFNFRSSNPGSGSGSVSASNQCGSETLV
jgi:hypothetical protein